MRPSQEWQDSGSHFAEGCHLLDNVEQSADPRDSCTQQADTGRWSAFGSLRDDNLGNGGRLFQTLILLRTQGLKNYIESVDVNKLSVV